MKKGGHYLNRGDDDDALENWGVSLGGGQERKEKTLLYFLTLRGMPARVSGEEEGEAPSIPSLRRQVPEGNQFPYLIHTWEQGDNPYYLKKRTLFSNKDRDQPCLGKRGKKGKKHREHTHITRKWKKKVSASLVRGTPTEGMKEKDGPATARKRLRKGTPFLGLRKGADQRGGKIRGDYPYGAKGGIGKSAFYSGEL